MLFFFTGRTQAKGCLFPVMSLQEKSRKPGFTLVELLVVIVIIAALTAVGFNVGPKMLARGKATKSLQNLSQIGPLFSIYAADHGMKLPPAKAPTTLPDGTVMDLQWNEVCLALLYPETNPERFRTKEWWDGNDTFMRNPLFKATAKPRGWTPLNPGYAINLMIPENLAIASTDTIPSHEELLAVSVPLAVLSDPSRTPMIAPSDNYFFRYDPEEMKGFTNGTLKDFLIEGKVPVLFVDGHVESIRPAEYLKRKLFLQPSR